MEEKNQKFQELQNNVNDKYKHFKENIKDQGGFRPYVKNLLNNKIIFTCVIVIALIFILFTLMNKKYLNAFHLGFVAPLLIAASLYPEFELVQNTLLGTGLLVGTFHGVKGVFT